MRPRAAGRITEISPASDIYAPVSGEVIEVNPAVEADPSLVNTDPYGQGWMVRIRTNDPSPLASLKDGAAYDASLAGA